MKSQQYHGLVVLAWLMVYLLPELISAFLTTTSPPHGHHQRCWATASRKHKHTEPPVSLPTIPDGRSIVVVVVNEKTTRFYHGLLRPPFTRQVPTATYVHPSDPYQYEVFSFE
jgi:hypothetical protein